MKNMKRFVDKPNAGKGGEGTESDNADDNLSACVCMFVLVLSARGIESFPLIWFVCIRFTFNLYDLILVIRYVDDFTLIFCIGFE